MNEAFDLALKEGHKRWCTKVWWSVPLYCGQHTVGCQCPGCCGKEPSPNCDCGWLLSKLELPHADITPVGSGDKRHDPERRAIIRFIHRAIGTMTKRVWTPGEGEDDYQELPDGAVPVWWLEEQLTQLKKAVS